MAVSTILTIFVNFQNLYNAVNSITCNLKMCNFLDCPILVNIISEECLEGSSANVGQMSIWT